MNRLTLILIAGAAALAALFLTHDDGTIVDHVSAGKNFLPELATHVNEATALAITKGTESIELERRGDDWVVSSKGGYPAKFEAVRSLLISLARLEDAEPRTSRADRLGELMLSDSGDTAGTHVTVKGKDGTQLADLVVGKARWQPSQAVYLRHAGEDQAYLLEGNVRAQPQPTTWLDTSIVRWPAVDVAGLTIEGDVTARLGRDGTHAIVLEEGLPEGRALKTPSPFNALFGALARLDFADVAPASETPGTLLRTLTFTTADGGAIVLHLFKDDADKTWARLEAKASEPQAPAAPASQAAVGPPAPDDTAADLAAPEEPKISPEQVATWTAAWSPWTFELPAYRISALLATWDDWLEPLPEPEPAEGPSSAPTDG